MGHRTGKARLALKGDLQKQFFTWALGASMFANVVAYFGISYFDQTIVAWYALLAMICAAGTLVRSEQQAQVRAMPNPLEAESWAGISNSPTVEGVF